MQEVWLPVVGYEGLYEVSDWGRVKSLARTCPKSSGGTTRKVPERILALHMNPHGYWQVHLSQEGRPRNFRVHVLVAAAFLGPKPEGLVICHGPGGKQDNRPGNLSYKTQAENMADKYRDGTEQTGERHPMAKLTEAQVHHVRRELLNAPRGTAARLARELGVNKACIGSIKRGKSWAS
jgi:hypothetical protein